VRVVRVTDRDVCGGLWGGGGAREDALGGRRPR